MASFVSLTLPDEITKEILAPLFVISDKQFFYMGSVSPFSAPSSWPCSCLLVVCKQWMRVTTPLLYESIVLRSQAQAQALVRAIQLNKAFGLHIKRLRVEGGFGACMANVIKLAPNIRDLTLSLDIWSPDNTSGLVKALSTLALVQRLGLVAFSREQGPTNKAARSLFSCISECIAVHWKLLHSIWAPYPYPLDPNEPRFGFVLPSTLERATGPITLLVPLAEDMRLYLSVFLEIKSIKKVVILREALNDGQDGSVGSRLRNYSRDKTIQSLSDYISFNPNLSSKVEIEAPRATNGANISDSSTSGVSGEEDWILRWDPNYTPLANALEADQESIWGRIIFYATEAGQHSADAVFLDALEHNFSLDPTKKISLSQIRLWTALVSRRFYRLARPYLYQNVKINTVLKIISFALSLVSEPSLGECIRVLVYDPQDLGFAPPIDSDFDVVSANQILTSALESSQLESEPICSSDLAKELYKKSKGYFNSGSGSSPLDDVLSFSPSPDNSARVQCCHLAMEYILSRATNLTKLTCDRSLWSRQGNWYFSDKVRSFEDAVLPTWRHVSRLPAKANIQYLGLALSPVAGFVPGDVDFSAFKKLRNLLVSNAPTKAASGNADGGQDEQPLHTPFPDRNTEEGSVQDNDTIPLEKIVCYEAHKDVSEFFFGLEHSRRPEAGFTSTVLYNLLPLRLPRLTSFELNESNAASCYKEGFRPALVAFMQQHGGTLRSLRIDADSLRIDWDIYGFCPNLEELTLEGGAWHQVRDAGLQGTVFSATQPHMHLRTVKLLVSRNWLYQEEVNKQFVDDHREDFLGTDFSKYPALRQIWITTCRWPLNEREIKRSHKILWVDVSSEWKSRWNITLLDVKGVHWTPRLGSVSRGKTRKE